MAFTSKPIRELLAQVDNNELVLPEIQREFVWARRSVKLLFDSLYRELPIGHMLVWRTRSGVHRRAFAHQRKVGNVAYDTFYGYLLDGQQRLTAISRVRDGDDDYRLLFNLWPEPESDKQLFYWSVSWAEGDPWLIPVARVLENNFSPMAYLKLLKEDESFKDAHEEPVFKALTQLTRTLDYVVGITEFDSPSYEEATELFIRFNSTGRKLNKRDLAMAELALKVPGLSANEISKALSKWQPQFRFTRPFLIQCLAALHTGRMNWTRPKDLWATSEPVDIRKSWNATERALSDVLKVVSGTVRWDSSNWIPSFNILIPLVVVLAAEDTLTPSDRDLARRWLLLAGVHSYFSGRGYALLDRVLRKLQPKPSVKKLWKITAKRLRRLRPEDFRTGRTSGPVMSLYVSMLRNTNATDWREHTPLDGTVVGHNAKLQIHHFFPRALLQKSGYDSADIDTFANYAIISADTNLHISTEEPGTYLVREKIREKDLSDQCIPLDTALWRVDKYENFLDAREKLLASRANEFLGF